MANRHNEELRWREYVRKSFEDMEMLYKGLNSILMAMLRKQKFDPDELVEMTNEVWANQIMAQKMMDAEKRWREENPGGLKIKRKKPFLNKIKDFFGKSNGQKKTLQTNSVAKGPETASNDLQGEQNKENSNPA